MDPVSIVQKGEPLHFTDLKRRIFESAIQVLRHEQRRWSISSVRRMLIGPVSDAFDSYAAVFTGEGTRPFTLPTTWRGALDALIAKIDQLFFEQQESDEPNWTKLEEDILLLAKENGVGVLRLPPFPLEKVSVGMDVLGGPLK